MAKITYVYNTSTGKLHIKGYCYYSNANMSNTNYKFYEREDDVYKENGDSVRRCITCAKQREKILAENNERSGKR